MWSSGLGGDASHRRELGVPVNLWHREDAHVDRRISTGTTQDLEGHNEHDDSDSTGNGEGTWGERDVGHFDEHEAMEELEVLRHNLSRLQGTRTRDSRASGHFDLTQVRSRRSEAADALSTQARVELGDDEKAVTEEEEEFELGKFMRDGHFEKRTEHGSEKRVGVIYKNLTVKGVESASSFVRTLPDAIIGTFGPDLYHIVSRFFPFLRFGRNQSTRILINDFTGCVRDGEMMLVLGRPGSGCSTFLKAASNNVDSFAVIEGEISYGGIPSKKQKQMYRGEVNYNPEDDIHFASLNVWQTFTFALMNKTKKGAKEEIPIIANALLKIFGIGHTKYTLVGDDYTRGVSGGERKRVSIAETLASKSTVMAWDNSTRGLDASTALDYAKSLRIMTDISNRTTLVTLYQAGEGIYELMDKVLVIDQGRQIFSGPAKDAKQYFIDLGFECPERQTTADFLTAVTDPNERRFRPGFEDRAPKTAEELETAFRNSPNYQKLLEDVKDYEEHLQRTDFADARKFEGAVQEAKSRHVSKKSPYTVSFTRQVWACTKREFWLLIGDKLTLGTKFFITISSGLIVGSIYFKEPFSTAGAFTRGGALFFSVVFLGWLQLAELGKAVGGRAIVARHRDYAFYRPSAVSLARLILDFPLIFAQVSVFGIAMYFMTNLDVDVSKFWIYLLFVYTTTIMITALYRMFASLSPEIDTAVRFSTLALNLLVIFTGYAIPKTQLLDKYIWFGWLYWINPLSYSFEAVLTNELSDQLMDCAPEQLVPRGSNILPGYQGCALTGSKPNSQVVAGSDYLQTALGYSRSNLWRNFGVVIAFSILYLLITVFATEMFDFSSDGGGALIFKKSRRAKKQAQKAATPSDIENGGADSSGSSATRVENSQATSEEQNEALGQLTKSESIFTWRDVEYTVPYLGGQRKLLNKVNGYAKPGIMVALMGASGAGKSTLLNTLAQRQRTGVVTGEMFVDGKPLGPEFQRNTGFCLQGDLHDETQTIREAIEFSALLRQEASVPRAEKLAYVDKIIDLLELNDLQDAIISSLGVELRKRLTIGVELAAKPSLLLFLDEPTSGLDSQSAYSIVTFLKKLCAAGQAIVCTIHQPSSVLIQQFDMVLALNPGGNTFYFGPIGENGKDVIDYFAQRGATCPPEKNVAEFILETAARPHRRSDGTKVDWNEEWRNSEQAQAVIEEIDGLKRVRSTVPQGGDISNERQREFAASAWVQTVELTKRMFRQYWRKSSYLYGRLFVAVLIGIFNGFTFWKLGNSVQDMQNRMFTIFLIIIIPATIVNAVVPRFDQNLGLWQAREYPSRIYGWVAFSTANIVAEIPAAIASGIIYWALWCWPSGLADNSLSAGYSFIMTVLMFLFMTSWGQWICAFAPSLRVIDNVLPFFFVMFSLFNGVVRSYSTLPVFWRYWMYWVNPSTYWIGGMLAASIDGVPVHCDPSETAQFNAPPNETCQSYAGEFTRNFGGYLLNPEATTGCQYCPYSVGNEYLATLNINASEIWRDFGIFLAFCISNWALVYFFIYTVRIRNWSFGLGYVFGALGKLVKVLKR